MEIISEIKRLREEKKAVILAHTYQNPEIQELADFVGDSYGLSVKASQLQDAEMIVFCGVRFMAETAYILNPGKTVLMPDADAGCPMADTITAEQLRSFKALHPGAPVVCYVNSTAEVKAESTICCTSSNAVKIVRSLGDVPEILFVPDKNLGHFVEEQLHRKLVLWNGGCPIHQAVRPEHIDALRRQCPGARVMVHPETNPDVQAKADIIAATGEMIRIAKESPSPASIIGTERGILHALKEAVPSEQFFPIEPPIICADMKKTTPEKLLRCLQTGETKVTVPQNIAERALKSIRAMLDVK